MRLHEELQLRKPFEVPSHEAMLNIYYTSVRIRKRAADFFRRYDLTDAKFNVLMLLEHHCRPDGGLSQIELSRMLLVNRANITSLIDRMEKVGLVERTPDPEDRRLNLIRLTDLGRDRLHAAQEAYFQEIGETMSVLDEQEVDALIRSLEKIRANLRG